MAVITLKELVSLNQQCSFPLGNFQASERSIQQQQFQQLVRQKRMGLNIEPLLNSQLAVWLEQLESFIPGIFDPRKKIYLDTRWQAQLQLEEVSHWLSVPINAGVVKNKVRLYEWRIGSAELIWSDRVKLWIACNYLQYPPEKLVIVICGFLPQLNGRVTKTHWDERDYKAIEKEIKSLFAENTSATSNSSKYSDYIFNIDEIEEVKL
ncbi:hypothetical protein IQ255_30595 [Pleurocapsales cyanobacterium LEGE 10410]|nr:hypothetical protein [Pleurocapsales cyanobacterium LEGE 10410]